MSFIYIVYYLVYSFSNRNDGMILRQLWLYIFLFLCFTVQAQRRVEITGKVIDSEGGPMDLVTVAVPAASTGTFTNEKGEFKLKITPSDTVGGGVFLSRVSSRNPEIGRPCGKSFAYGAHV